MVLKSQIHETREPVIPALRLKCIQACFSMIMIDNFKSYPSLVMVSWLIRFIVVLQFSDSRAYYHRKHQANRKNRQEYRDVHCMAHSVDLKIDILLS